MKTRSFICYGKVETSGIKQVLFKTTISPGDDPISKNLTPNQTAAEFATYVKTVVDSNTLISGAVVTPTTENALITLITNHIAARVNTERNRIKLALVRSTTNVPQLMITQTVNGVKVLTFMPLVA